jgi:hypothetical protein
MPIYVDFLTGALDRVGSLESRANWGCGTTKSALPQLLQLGKMDGNL